MVTVHRIDYVSYFLQIYHPGVNKSLKNLKNLKFKVIASSIMK